MKKIGKQVHFLPTGDVVKRAGEGAFVRLKDGRILAFSQKNDETTQEKYETLLGHLK